MSLPDSSRPDLLSRDSLHPDHERRRSWALAKMRAADCRSTRPRTLVLAVLAQAEGHLTVEAVHARASAAGRVDPSTIYRTLSLLERLHIVHTLAVGGRVTYGLADHPHAHTVCDGCAVVTALHDGELGDLPALVRRGLEGFATTGIVIRGHCTGCRSRRSPEGRPGAAPAPRSHRPVHPESS